MNGTSIGSVYGSEPTAASRNPDIDVVVGCGVGTCGGDGLHRWVLSHGPLCIDGAALRLRENVPARLTPPCADHTSRLVNARASRQIG